MKSHGTFVSVSKAIFIEDCESCDARDDHKIGYDAIGRLKRSRRKVIINVFEDCQKLIINFIRLEIVSAKDQKIVCDSMQ